MGVQYIKKTALVCYFCGQNRLKLICVVRNWSTYIFRLFAGFLFVLRNLTANKNEMSGFLYNLL